MIRRTMRIATTALALALVAGLVAAQGAAAAPFKRCAKSKVLECMQVTVPLDRSGRVKGTVGLAVRRLAARQGPARGTIVFLAGGPGQSATSVFSDLGGVFRRALPDFDIVTFDQRGTGRSGALRCPSASSAGVLKCARRLGARRGVYRSSDSADDLEAVRLAIGAPLISLYSVSYGGRVAGEYARRYPAAVGRMVLDSPTPLFGIESLEQPKLASLPRVLAAVCANEACSGFTRSAYGDLTRVAARARRRPLRVSLVSPRGRKIRTGLPASVLFGLVVESDLSAAVRLQIPAVLKSASRGDTAPLARLALRAQSGGATAQSSGAISFLLNRVTNCSESNLPWSPASKPGPDRGRAISERVAALGAQRFAPFGVPTILVNSLVGQCLNWPRVPTPGVVATAPGPPAPTLVVNGEEDLRTPVEDGQTVAAGYPAVQQLVVPYVGHSVLGTDQTACSGNAVFAFLNGGAAPPSCPPAPRPGRVAFPLPVRLEALPGKSRQLKTRAAAILTIDDLLTQLDLAGSARRFGGLRAGRVQLGKNRLKVRLVNYQVFAGVRLNGSLDGRGRGFTARLRIAGGGARSASVRVLRGGRIRLRFGGAQAASAALSGRLPRSEIPDTPRTVAPTP